MFGTRSDAPAAARAGRAADFVEDFFDFDWVDSGFHGVLRRLAAGTAKSKWVVYGRPPPAPGSRSESLSRASVSRSRVPPRVGPFFLPEGGRAMAEDSGHCEFELLIRGGVVVDGSGGPRRRLDVAIAAGRIAAMEPTLAAATATKVIEAEGMIIAPGFIDVHTHDDNSLLDTPDMAYKTSQGVTTVVAGNCGISLAPFVRPTDGSRDTQGEVIPPLNLLGSTFAYPTVGSLFDAMDAAPAAVNAVVLCGHTTLRIGVMGSAAMERTATASELEEMQVMLQEALDAGAIGLSTGLAYASAIEATTEEVISLARLLQPAGALCECCTAPHSRTAHHLLATRLLHAALPGWLLMW